MAWTLFRELIMRWFFCFPFRSVSLSGSALEMKLLKLRKTISRWYFCCFIINSTAQKSISTFTSTKTKMLLNSMIHVKARRARNLFVRSAQLSTIVRQLHCARTRWKVGRVFSSTFRFNQFSYRWSLLVKLLEKKMNSKTKSSWLPSSDDPDPIHLLVFHGWFAPGHVHKGPRKPKPVTISARL